MDGPTSTDRSVVIVALPSNDDLVNQLSSEKVPHLTLLYLGEPNYTDSEWVHVTDFVEYASSLLTRFSLDVLNRGTLGDKDADVLFFNKKWAENIATFRRQLIADPLISRAYVSTDQFPDWAPHLTMGYPSTPAKAPSKDMYPGIGMVNFDRIAIWTSDYDGPTFELKPYDYDLGVGMSQLKSPSQVMGDGSVSHYGVKGMHWGVRKGDGSGGSSSPVKSAPKPRTSEDHKEVSKLQDKLHSGGPQSLSNKELQTVLSRMDLERRYEQAATQKSQIDQGLAASKRVLKVGKTIEDARKFMETPTGKAVAAGVGAAFTAIRVAVAFKTGGASAAAGAGAAVAVRKVRNHYTNVGN